MKKEIGMVVDWSKVDKETTCWRWNAATSRISRLSMLKAALTDEIHSREVYIKGIDHSYYYEGYAIFKAGELQKNSEKGEIKMSNSIKKEYDKLSITNDIIERETIIQQFQTKGFFDRNDAINKIMSLKNSDAELAIVTMIKQVESGSVNLYQVDDNIIITNIQFQIDFLKTKIAKLALEEKENG